MKKFFVLIGFAVLGLSVVFLLPSSSYAVDRYWIAGDGWWDNGTNWNPEGQPQNGDSVYLTISDDIDRIIHYENTLYPNAILPFLQFSVEDYTKQGRWTFFQDQDVLAVDQEILGNGTFSQGGGLHRVNRLEFESRPFSETIYNLGGTGILSAHSESVGEIGASTFNQSGGTHTITRRLSISSHGGATYNLSGTGSLTAYDEGISTGDDTPGVFNQTGGTHTVVNVLDVASGNGVGYYNLSGGSLSVFDEYIGKIGPSTGRFNQTGGTHTVTNDLYISAYGRGNYNLSGTGSLTAYNEYIGSPGNSEGIFNQSGGSHTVTNSLKIGYSGDPVIDGSLATYNLSGTGILTAHNEEIFGGLLYGNATFNQAGGIHTITNDLNIGRTNSSNSSYNLSGGALTAENVVNNQTFNYSGGGLSANLTNNGTTTLSGDGIRTINGDVNNDGTFATTETTGRFTGTFTNSAIFNSDLSVNHFAHLVIAGDGTMGGSEEDTWYVSGILSGVEILSDTVINIFGAPGMKVYYSPFVLENAYLEGLSYNLNGGGQLLPFSTTGIMEFFDYSVGQGTLLGSGPGRSGMRRLNALKNMIEEAGDLLNTGLYDEGCHQLKDAYNRCDGDFPPPDFVGGTAVEELESRIKELMTGLGCEIGDES
jgi:hypothetical protein